MLLKNTTQLKFIYNDIKIRAWQDSNLQSSDPKSDALSIRPHAHKDKIFKDCIFWFQLQLCLKFNSLSENLHALDGFLLTQNVLFVQFSTAHD